MHVIDLSDLTTEQVDDYNRRYLANIALHSIDEATAVRGNGGMIARVAANLAAKDVRNRRQLPGRTR